MSDCLFCKIVRGEIPSEKVYEDEEIYAFRDINPCAPVHVLVIPKKHIDGMDKLTEGDEGLAGRLVFTAARLAEKENLTEGYRILTNTGGHGGQTVRHLHFHLIGGKKLSMKMG